MRLNEKLRKDMRLAALEKSRLLCYADSRILATSALRYITPNNGCCPRGQWAGSAQSYDARAGHASGCDLQVTSKNKPDISRLRIFGSRVLVHVPDEQHSKLAAKGTEKRHERVIIESAVEMSESTSEGNPPRVPTPAAPKHPSDNENAAEWEVAWQESSQDELCGRGVCEAVRWSRSTKTSRVKWVFRVKCGGGGEMWKYKTRVVVQHFR
ncbi:hypothetical protein EDB84DRAFT_1438906 [Lactarius hengduanensis]|nr:hypothetical protein EDB84DRAFT_1438906 [Lactarius hengduanensis]